MASWTATEVLVNGFAEDAFKRGALWLRVLKDCDLAVRHPESFVRVANVVVP